MDALGHLDTAVDAPDLPLMTGYIDHAQRSSLMTIGSKEEVVAGLRVQVRDTADPVAREMLCAVQAITTGLTQYKLWHAGVLSVFRAAAKFLSINTVSPAQTVYGIPRKEITAWLGACKDAGYEVLLFFDAHSSQCILRLALHEACVPSEHKVTHSARHVPHTQRFVK